MLGRRCGVHGRCLVRLLLRTPDEEFYYAGSIRFFPRIARRSTPRLTRRNNTGWCVNLKGRELLLLNLTTLVARRYAAADDRLLLQGIHARLPFPEQDCMAICAPAARCVSVEYALRVSNVYYRVDAETTPFYAHCLCLPENEKERRDVQSGTGRTDTTALHGAENRGTVAEAVKQGVWMRTSGSRDRRLTISNVCRASYDRGSGATVCAAFGKLREENQAMDNCVAHLGVRHKAENDVLKK